jgi:hypothetical protein
MLEKGEKSEGEEGRGERKITCDDVRTLFLSFSPTVHGSVIIIASVV